MIDMDGMKQINDTGGHLAGDRALATVGKALRESTRPTDLVGRFGGDEFVVLLPRTGTRAADRVAHRVIRALAPHVLIVGVPYNADGSDGSSAQAARDFGVQLSERFALPVEHVDEHGSSIEAGRALKEQRASGQRRRREMAG